MPDRVARDNSAVVLRQDGMLHQITSPALCGSTSRNTSNRGYHSHNRNAQTSGWHQTQRRVGVHAAAVGLCLPSGERAAVATARVLGTVHRGP